jgi:hypothetical protein
MHTIIIGTMNGIINKNDTDGVTTFTTKIDNTNSIRRFSEQYDPEPARRAVEILLKNRVSEIKQIAEDIECLPTDYTNNRDTNWEEKVIRFCLDVDICFDGLSKVDIGDEQAHECMNLIQIMSKHKTLNEAQKLQWLAYNTAQDFKLLYAQETEAC